MSLTAAEKAVLVVVLRRRRLVVAPAVISAELERLVRRTREILTADLVALVQAAAVLVALAVSLAFSWPALVAPPVLVVAAAVTTEVLAAAILQTAQTVATAV